MKSLISFFTKEHLFGNLITILILISGLYTTFTLKRDVFPKVDFNVTVISTILPGASPSEVEKSVLNVIEPRLREIEGIKLIQSSATESMGIINIQLDADSRDKDLTNADIQKAIDRLEGLPNEAEKPIVTSIESGITPLIEVNLSGEASPFKLREASQKLYNELSSISAVASVTKSGYLKKELLVEADAQKLAERQISLASLIQNIQQNNNSIPGGTHTKADGSEVLIRTESKLETKEDLANVVLLTNDAGFETRLSDVAEITETLAKPQETFRFNGSNSIILRVAKKANKDALNLAKEVRERALSMKEQLGQSINLSFSNDFSVYLSTRLNTLSASFTIGLLLICIVLTFFLPWQATLVVSAGIPVALFATVMTASALGFSINLISLLGLIIVLGMLVDDALVVCENISRHLEVETDQTKAIVNGANEVFIPILASILTTISAFGPMLFMTGIFGAFILQIPAMVILALIFSLLEAFIIMPAHFSSWVIPFIKQPSKLPPNSKNKKKWIERLNRKYKTYVHWSLKHRYWIALASLVPLLMTIPLLMSKGNFVLFPANEGTDFFFVEVEATPNTSIKKMEQKVAQIEKHIAQLPANELKDFSSTIGLIQQSPFDPATARGSHYANIRVTVHPGTQRDRKLFEIIESMRSTLTKPKGVTSIKVLEAKQGPPQGDPVSIDLIGENLNELLVIADKITAKVTSIEGVIDIKNSFQKGKREWKVQPKFKEMALVGLTSSDIGLSVRAAFEGIVASSFRGLEEETDIRVRLKTNDKERKKKEVWHQTQTNKTIIKKASNQETEKNSTNEKDLENTNIHEKFKSIQIGNQWGRLTPLTEVANIRLFDSLSSINHIRGQRMVKISAQVDTQKTTALLANSQIKPLIKDILKEHPSYSVRYGGEDQDTRESLQSLISTAIFAIFIIFAILIITFKSILQPLIILSSLPMGFMGATYSLWLHGRPFSFMAMLGIVALAGVIVNNAIVLTDFVNRYRKSGADLNESIAEAARIRLRPILLTTLTTICGLLPTAYGSTIQDVFGIGAGDPFVTPIALTLGWGLAIGTTMTSLFFPSFLRILDDIQGLLTWLTYKVIRR